MATETRQARRASRAADEQDVGGRESMVRTSGTREEGSSQAIDLPISLSEARQQLARRHISRKEFDAIVEEAIRDQDDMLGHELRHLRNCPNEDDMPRVEGSRVEAYDLTGRGDLKYRAVRCAQCGEGVVSRHVEEA